MFQPLVESVVRLESPRRGYAGTLAPCRIDLPEGFVAPFQPAMAPYTELLLPDTLDPDSKLLMVLGRFDERHWKQLLRQMDEATTPDDWQGLGLPLREAVLRLYRISPAYLQYMHGFTINLMRHLAGQFPYFRLPTISAFMLDLNEADAQYLIAHTAHHTVLPDIMGFNLAHFQMLQLAARFKAPVSVLRSSPGLPFQLGTGYAQLLPTETTYATDVNCPLAAILSPKWLVVIGSALHEPTPKMEMRQLTTAETTQWNERMATQPSFLCFPT
jgi:hypothetical protein